MLPASTTPVPENTANRPKRRSLAVQAAGSTAIEQRLPALDAEWDIERMVETNAATVPLVGLTLGATIDRPWFILIST